MGKYNVSGIKIEFNYCFDNYFKDRISSYQISDNEIVDYQINVRLKEEIKLPNFNPKMIINRRNIYETKNNSTIICGTKKLIQINPNSNAIWIFLFVIFYFKNLLKNDII